MTCVSFKSSCHFVAIEFYQDKMTDRKMFSSSIETRQLFFILLLMACVWASENSTSSGWEKLQISPNPVCSMPYENFRLNIYERSVNKMTTIPSQKRFFYDPILLVDHKSAELKYNNVTQLGKMRFRIEMWNDNLEVKVIHYLSEYFGQEIKLYQVQVIPFEKVFLISTNPESSTIYSLSTDWHPYYLEKSLWFSLTCFDQENCHRLKDTMHQNPMEFDNLKLLFSLSSQKSQTKEVTIRFKNIYSSPTIKKLVRQCLQKGYASISTEDEKRLLSEITTNLIVELFDESEVVSPIAISQIYDALKGLLFSSNTEAMKNDNTSESVCFNIEEENKDDGKKSHKECDEKKLAFPKSKIDLRKLYRQQFQDFSVKVRFSTTTLSTFVRFDPFAELSTTDEWAQLKKELKEFKNEYQNLKIEHQNLKMKHPKLETEPQHQKDLSEESESAATDVISFSARENILVGPYGSSPDIVYREIVKNSGNGLDEATGIFTVPKKGTYKFTFYANVDPCENSLVFMKKNGMKLENAYHSADSQASCSHFKPLSISTVQYFYTNDTIWINSVYGSLTNIEFSGILEVEKK